jgi:hypothetical protein
MGDDFFFMLQQTRERLSQTDSAVECLVRLLPSLVT